jgi:hypothetical protein
MIKMVVELIYICINTVPAIVHAHGPRDRHALSTITRYMTRATSYHRDYDYAKQVLRSGQIERPDFGKERLIPIDLFQKFPKSLIDLFQNQCSVL